VSDKFPNGWTNILLSDLTTICKDITYGILKPGPYEESGVPMLRVKDIRSNQVDDSEIYKVSLELAEEFSRTTLEGGEIVVSIQGTVGKVAIVPNRLSGANVSRTLAVIAPLIPEFGKWIRFFLLSPSGQSEIIKRIGGTTRASLNLRDLRQIEIKVAPLVEQHRIVAKIEELFTRLDAGVETLKQVQAQLKRYRQSVLKAAVEGRLTAEWRGGHQDELEFIIWPPLLKQ
jgi:type I restriction enzyme S subunit